MDEKVVSKTRHSFLKKRMKKKLKKNEDSKRRENFKRNGSTLLGYNELLTIVEGCVTHAA